MPGNHGRIDLEALNPPQRQAVTFGSGPLVVFAGAGSGKTRVITYRVAFLAQEMLEASRGILAVTFTNKAAREMRERLLHLLPDSHRVVVGTFHSVSARLLRAFAPQLGMPRDFVIYDDADQRSMLQRVVRELGLDERRFEIRSLAASINRAKQEALLPDEVEVGDFYSEIVQKVYRSYQSHLQRAGAMDFGDLIFRLVHLLEGDEVLRQELSHRFQFLLVDEFQDTNRVQYRLLRDLCSSHRNLCVVGDDDQSIYRWRGADRENILQFRREFPDAAVIKLEQNYRSTQRILRGAHAVIEHNRSREPKRLWTENEEGDPLVVLPCRDERDEARLIVSSIREMSAGGHALSDVAILYRVHAQSRVLEEALRAQNLPYRIVGGTRFYDRSEIKDLLAYLRLVHNSEDDVALLRIINVPTRGIGKTTLEKIMRSAAERGGGVWQGLVGLQEYEPSLRKAAREKVEHFVELIASLRKAYSAGLGLGELGQRILDATSYVESLRREDSAEADARIQNLQEFIASLHDFEREHPEEGLGNFLEWVSLESDARAVETQDSLTLMTVHAAKGLEFPVVIVAGMEESLFPYFTSEGIIDEEELEEERRLAYVAFTRARERLMLTYAETRRLFGFMKVSTPSRFLRDLPEGDTYWVSWQRNPSPSSRPQVLGRQPSGFDGRTRCSEDETQGSYIDWSEGQEEGVFRLGARVRHPRFGEGKIQAIDPGTPPRVTVSFPQWGTKQIVASYLQPA